ncbi:MAG: protein TolR [Nitrospirae bacterium]|nr:protein TolR [Nitrospirota bacterium]
MKLERSSRSALSEINVTPLVDVMLVLLIIFMVTAPMMKQGLDIDLPKTKGSSMPNQDRFTITIKKDGDIYLNKEKMSQQELVKKLKAISNVNPDVYLEADKSVSYGKVAEIMAEVKAAGIEKLGMVTEPKAGE